MDRFLFCNDVFDHAISRALDMVSLYSGLSQIRKDPNNDDALRAAYFQAVSSFDFYVHELVAVEASYRFRNSIQTRNIVLPMELTMICDPEERFEAVESRIREGNSYKAFVDPGKISEILSCFCDNPWDAIVENYNINNERVDKSELKSQLKSIWRRRNKIAHEADVDPTYSGVSLWPIDKVDTEITIEFIRKLGSCLPYVVSRPLKGG